MVADEAVIAEIADGGTADLPFPGMVAPSVVGIRGRGLWLASELCDVLQVWSDSKGTVVRLRMDHEAGWAVIPRYGCLWQQEQVMIAGSG